MAAVHVVEAQRSTLHGAFSRDVPPVATVEPGDLVRFSTIDVGWGLEQHHGATLPRRKLEPRDAERDDGPALTGPVAVAGAEPGQTLELVLEDVVPGSWGWTFAGGPWGLAPRLGLGDEEPRLVRWSIDRTAATATSEGGVRVPLRPFPGTIGIAPAEPGWHPGWPPRLTGGNLDCRELVAGARLFLPIAVPGALLSAGDGHAAQGDGEVAGMAIECPLERLDVRVLLRDDLALRAPAADTPAGWITFGIGEDLDAAAIMALDAMLDVVAARAGCDRVEALAVASAVVDLRVTQAVNPLVGVHAVLPHAALAAAPAA